MEIEILKNKIRLRSHFITIAELELRRDFEDFASLIRIMILQK